MIKIHELPKEKILFYIVAAITILGALFVRLNGLIDYYYNSDEAWHLVVAGQKSIFDVIRYNFQQEVHPPLSPLIWHFMMKISDNMLWLRSASFIPAILLIPSIYILGNLSIGRAAAFAMAVIAAFGAMDMNPGVIIRAYPMMLLVLAWAGIFMYKYLGSGSKKDLSWYFAMAFISTQLVHSSAFLIIPYGLLLMWDAYKKKEKNILIIIIAGHILLAVLTLGYAYVLKHYYGFEGNYGYFSSAASGSFTDYLLIALKITIGLMRRMLSLEDGNMLLYIFSFFLLIMLACMVICKRKDLLFIAFLPLLLVTITNYFVIYPFPTYAIRSNSFLFIPFLFLFGFPAQKFYEMVLLKFIKKEYHFYVAAFLVAVIPLTWLVHDSMNTYLKPIETSGEYYVPKKQFEKYIKYVSSFQKEDTVMLTENQMVWYFSYLEKDSAKIEYLTKNLGHFKSKNYEFYFTSFPGRESDIMFSFYDLEKASSDLLAELKKNGRLPHIKTIVYSHIGGDYEFLGGVMRMGLQLQQNPSQKLDFTGPPAMKSQFNVVKEMLTSKQVKFKIYERSLSNTYITIMGMTPEFLEKNLVGKEFINVKEKIKDYYLKK